MQYATVERWGEEKNKEDELGMLLWCLNVEQQHLGLWMNDVLFSGASGLSVPSKFGSYVFVLLDLHEARSLSALN